MSASLTAQKFELKTSHERKEERKNWRSVMKAADAQGSGEQIRVGEMKC